MKRDITVRINLSNLNSAIACMMLKTRTLAFVLTMCSCAHTYYIPKSPNVPLFTEKNEFRGSISLGEGIRSYSTDLQAAYSISDHFGVMTDFMSSSGTMYFNKNSATTRYFDGGLGYFKPFDKFMVFEVYGGFGVGYQKHVYYSTDWNSGQTTLDGNADIHYIKSFLQPSLGATFKVFDIALSTGLTRLNYNIESNTVISGSPYAAELSLIAENRNPVLFEPALTIRAGWKYVKVQLQYVYSYNLTSPEMYLEKSKVSLGIYFSISNKYKKDVQTK